MKNHVTLPQFLTEAEIEQALVLWRELRGTGRFAAEVERQIVAPNLARIDRALGQANNARYLAYLIEYVFTEADQPQPEPGHLWEVAEDVCETCGKHLGYGVRFLHLGRCETCPPPKTH